MAARLGAQENISADGRFRLDKAKQGQERSDATTCGRNAVGLVHRLSPYQSQPGIRQRLASWPQHPLCWPPRRPRRNAGTRGIASYCNVPCVGDSESVLHLIGLRILPIITSARKENPVFRPCIQLLSDMSLHVRRCCLMF